MRYRTKSKANKRDGSLCQLASVRASAQILNPTDDESDSGAEKARAQAAVEPRYEDCNKQIYFRHFFAKLFRHFSFDFCDSFVLVYS